MRHITIIQAPSGDWAAVYDTEVGNKLWEGHYTDLEPEMILDMAEAEFTWNEADTTEQPMHHATRTRNGFPYALKDVLPYD